MAKKAPAKKTSIKKTPAKKATAKTVKPKAMAAKKPEKITPKKVMAEIVDEDMNPDLEIPKPVAKSGKVSKVRTISDEDVPLIKDNAKSVATTDPISMYLAEIRKYPLLSREQELELAKKYYDTKDPVAAQALVTANLRFVVKVAAEYSRFGARMIDLVQEGNMGLMHAVKDYNPYKGVRLITYAVWWIRGYIQEYLMKQFSLVKIGTTQNQKKLFYQLQKQKEELEALGKGADIKLLSEKLGIPEDEVQMMAQRMSGRDVSLDRPLDDDSKGSLMDMQSGDSTLPDEELSHREQLSHLTDTIEELRPQLSDREKIILDERILNDEPLTLQEIGEKYGITREAVRQMEVRVMTKIKNHFAKG